MQAGKYTNWEAIKKSDWYNEYICMSNYVQYIYMSNYVQYYVCPIKDTNHPTPDQKVTRLLNPVQKHGTYYRLERLAPLLHVVPQLVTTNTKYMRP